jgi:putative membrane protein
MATDHSKANEELKKMATQKNITVPTSMGAEKQKEFDKLNQKKGAEFDKAYSDMMVSDHEKDLKLFKKEAEEGSDKDLKTWAKGKVLVLEHHLMMAKSTCDAVKKEL